MWIENKDKAYYQKVGIFENETKWIQDKTVPKVILLWIHSVYWEEQGIVKESKQYEERD